MGSAAENKVSKSASNNNIVKYDLYRGHPNDHALPSAEIQSVMASLLNDNHKESLVSSLGYGANAGNAELLSALRLFLDRRATNDHFAGATANNNKSEFFITNGVSHGIELLCATCTNSGDEVWIERPTYFLVPKIFTSHGLVIMPLPMMSDREGDEHNYSTGQIDIERLIIMVEKDEVPPPKMIYVIPSYHNPTGRSMTTEDRGKLAAFAIRNNILLVADEVYHFLDWDRDKSNQSSRPAAMTRFNNHIIPTCDNEEPSDGCCISVSSFTKIFAPGIRVGWIEAPPHIIQRLVNYAYINSQGGVAPFMGRLMAHAIETGMLDQYLDKLILEYSERYRLICKLLEVEPRINIITKQTASNREGGYFIWVQFPTDIDSEEFASYSLREHGVRFMAGNKSDPFDSLHENHTKQAIRSCARLCFADLDRDKLEQGVMAFVEAFRSFCDRQKN
jgi:DNA-binding transcriptional MocR family regulator